MIWHAMTAGKSSGGLTNMADVLHKQAVWAWDLAGVLVRLRMPRRPRRPWKDQRCCSPIGGCHRRAEAGKGWDEWSPRLNVAIDAELAKQCLPLMS